jgi:hypothetical protein
MEMCSLSDGVSGRFLKELSTVTKNGTMIPLQVHGPCIVLMGSVTPVYFAPN